MSVYLTQAEFMNRSPNDAHLPRFALDFETTGLDPANAQVIEVALRGEAILDRLVSDTAPSLPEALRLHGITTKLCRAQGHPSRQVLAELLAAMGPGPIEVVAHNASFEQEFLESWARREGIELPEIHWTCTLKASRRLMNKAPLGHKLGSLATSLGWQSVGLHRAAADAELTLRLFGALEAWQRVKEALGPNPGVVYLTGPQRGNGSSSELIHNQASMAILANWAQAVLPDVRLLVPHLDTAVTGKWGDVRTTPLSTRPGSPESMIPRGKALILFGEPHEEMRRDQELADSMMIPTFRVPGWDGPGTESMVASALSRKSNPQIASAS